MQPLSPAVSRGSDLYNTNSPSTSVVTIIRNHSHKCACAAFTSRGYYSKWCLFRSRASGCAANIQEWPLFKGGVYSKRYGISSGFTIEITSCSA